MGLAGLVAKDGDPRRRGRRCRRRRHLETTTRWTWRFPSRLIWWRLTEATQAIEVAVIIVVVVVLPLDEAPLLLREHVTPAAELHVARRASGAPPAATAAAAAAAAISISISISLREMYGHHAQVVHVPRGRRLAQPRGGAVEGGKHGHPSAQRCDRHELPHLGCTRLQVGCMG